MQCFADMFEVDDVFILVSNREVSDYTVFFSEPVFNEYHCAESSGL